MKTFEKNNVTIALNLLHGKKGKIYPTYVAKHNSYHEKQVIILMIPNKEKLWHYLALKKLLPLLRGVTFKHYGDFYCLNCLHSFRTKNKLKLHNAVSENKYFCNIKMSSEDTEILQFSQNQKSHKAPFVVYADLEFFK